LVENPLFVALVAVITSILASSGFWAFVQRKDGNRKAQSKLLTGLTHEMIVYLSVDYIKRGSVTKEEYDNLIEKLYKPYLELGGNGLAEKVVQQVGTLPIINNEEKK